MFKSKLKFITFLVSVVILSFVFGYFVFAVWTEPASSPPDENVPPPINVGTTPQAKGARISAPEFYDNPNSDYYLDPDGQSVLSKVNLSEIKIGNFEFKEILPTQLGIYDSLGNLILILD